MARTRRNAAATSRNSDFEWRLRLFFDAVEVERQERPEPYVARAFSFSLGVLIRLALGALP